MREGRGGVETGSLISRSGELRLVADRHVLFEDRGGDSENSALVSSECIENGTILCSVSSLQPKCPAESSA